MTHLSQDVEDLLSEQKQVLGDVFRSTYKNTHGDEMVSLNKYFRIQLSKAPVPTLDERECLIDDLQPEQWLKYFRGHVLPTLVRFNLPSA
jgi:hypothetical protein